MCCAYQEEREREGVRERVRRMRESPRCMHEQRTTAEEFTRLQMRRISEIITLKTEGRDRKMESRDPKW